MNILHVILYGLQQIKEERTAASVYHLLTGKRSAQTLQDATMYRLSFLFGVCKKLRRTVYENHLLLLVKEGWIVETTEKIYAVTDEGKRVVSGLRFPSYLDGLQYGEVGGQFWNRLSLLVQTASHLQKRIPFIPVQQDKEVTGAVKQTILHSAFSRQQIVKELYKECEEILKKVEEQDALVFVLRLSGVHRMGYTNEQISHLLQIDPFETYVSFLGTLHFFVQEVTLHGDRYPLLRMVLPEQQTVLSVSTQKTYALLERGYTIAEIATQRRIKENTVEDHIVEIVMHTPQFPVQRFLSEQKRVAIQQIVLEMNTRKLREIKEKLPAVSYFEIRLALALGGSACVRKDTV